jgi:NAD+ synthase
MPESESAPDALRLGRKASEFLRLPSVVEDITPILRAARYYQCREQLLRAAVPHYRGGSRFRVLLPAVDAPQADALYSVVIQSPAGDSFWAPLTPQAYQDIVAVTNLKQRTRRTMAYYYADRLDYAVIGTADRLKYDQGLFVKHGDGVADLEPIAHLFRSQVYQLARYLRVPAEICRRPPSTEVYPLQQAPGEPYLMLPVEDMDFCLYSESRGIPAGEVARSLDLETRQVEQIYQAARSKRAAAEYRRAGPILMRDAAAT